MNAAALHVAVLGHRDVGVPELIGPDPGREAFVVLIYKAQRVTLAVSAFCEAVP